MDLSLPWGHGRPRPPESVVTPLTSVRNPEAIPVRVTTKYHDTKYHATSVVAQINKGRDLQHGIRLESKSMLLEQNLPKTRYQSGEPRRGYTLKKPFDPHSENPLKRTPKKWTRDEYKDIM